MDKVLLIDGMFSIHRACIKFGAPTDVEDYIVFTFNFFRNLRATVEQFNPTKIYFLLEGHPQFRYDLYPDYKATRRIKIAANQSISKPLDAQKEKARAEILELIKHLPITVCRAANYEADDLIYTLCHNMKDEEIIVFSNDQDHIQLLQKGYSNVKVYDPIKKEYMSSPEYSQLAHKALAGDVSDHIPKLLSKGKALKTVNDPELFKQFLSLEENRANFNINRQLIEFRLVPPEEIIIQEPVVNLDKLKEEFTKFKFETIINEKSWKKFTSTFEGLL